MLIGASIMWLAVFQVIIPGSQTKPQPKPGEDPQFCTFLEDSKCQDPSIKAQCINFCKPKATDAEFCTHISPDKCTEAYISTECSHMCNRPARECGNYKSVSHILSIDERIRDATSSSSSILKELGGVAALYKSTTDLRSLTHVCGAILISEWHLLTAAHCVVDSESSFSISLGQDDLNESTSPGADTYVIVETIPHPLYKKTIGEYHDIAVLQTDRRVNFKDNIWPFCLPNSQQVYTDYMSVQIAGWGKVDAKHKAKTIKSQFVELVKRSRCKEIWIQNAPDLYNQSLKFDYQEGLTQNILCAGRNGVDACEGDSGGPMTHQSGHGLKTAIGVISRGIAGCPRYPELPGYYTNIKEYVGWINDIIGHPRVSLQNPTSIPKPVDEWSPWSPWSGCSLSCGEGQRQRTRRCTSQSQSRNAPECAGNHSQIDNCNKGQCPRNGGWSAWSSWGSCSLPCGGGQRKRFRSCNSPTPANGGSDCAGSNIMEDHCNLQLCSIDGGWSAWSPWSSCSSNCGGGKRSRRRDCNNPTPANGGQDCSGTNIGEEDCNSQPCGAECPSPWFRVHNQCFYGEKERSERRTWAEARIYCSTQAPGADLAQPTDIAALVEYMVDNGYTSLARAYTYWLGWSDQDREGQWVSVSGIALAHTNNWSQGQPNDGGDSQDCLAIMPRLGANSLYDDGCGVARPFLCERPTA